VLIVVVVGGAFLAAPVLKQQFSGWNEKEEGTEVRMGEAVTRTLIQTISAPGEIEPHTKVDISAEVSARIHQLPFREGEEVRKGDLVVKLDDRDLKAAMLSAQARRDSEKFRLQSDQARLIGLLSNHEFARRDLERKQKLYETGDISRSDLDAAEERERDFHANVEATKHSISVVESTLAAAEADIARAEKGLSHTIILAPIDGIITALNAEIGEVVMLGTMNNPGTVILTIADLDRMLLNAQVAETDVARVAQNQRSTIFINAYPDEEFSGTVRRIALQRSGAADGTGFFKTEVEIDLQGRRIYSGLVANVDIEIESHEGIVVPSQAVVERSVDEMPEAIRANPIVDTTKKTIFAVYRVVDGEAICTPVKTGASDLTHTVVTGGLDEGETVVVGPYKVLESIKHEEKVRDIKKAQAEKAQGDDAGDAETRSAPAEDASP
jgi:HlyD family secretion protein